MEHDSVHTVANAAPSAATPTRLMRRNATPDPGSLAGATGSPPIGAAVNAVRNANFSRSSIGSPFVTPASSPRDMRGSPMARGEQSVPRPGTAESASTNNTSGNVLLAAAEPTRQQSWSGWMTPGSLTRAAGASVRDSGRTEDPKELPPLPAFNSDTYADSGYTPLPAPAIQIEEASQRPPMRRAEAAVNAALPHGMKINCFDAAGQLNEAAVRAAIPVAAMSGGNSLSGLAEALAILCAALPPADASSLS